MSLNYFILGSILVFTSKAEVELRKINLTDPEALCNDKSRAVYYDDRKPSNKSWIIFFESGGLCTSKEDCNSRYKNENSTVFMTSTKLPEKITGKDLLSSSRSENPTFHDYRHVLVPYCSSDLWLGESTVGKNFTFMDNSSVNNFIFRGMTIFRSVFSTLEDQLISAEHVVVAGSSAGGIGVLNHAKWLSNTFLAKSNANLSFIIDSAWFINFQDGFKSRVKSEFIHLANTSVRSCYDLTYGFSCCLSAQCLLSRSYFPADKPLAFVLSLYDIYMFADVLKRLENNGKTVEDNAADFISMVSMYGGAMNESLELPTTAVENVSFFVPACFQHTYFSMSSLWDDVLNPLVEVTRGSGIFSHKVQSKAWVSTKIKKGGVSLSIQDFLSSWVKERNETRKVIDSCIGAHCNPTCPDKIVFLDTADIWGKIVKSVIIGLSLVITVVCCALKGSFMAYYLYLTRRQDKYLNDSAASETRKELPLCNSENAVSLACFFLSYAVDIKTKKKPKNDSGCEETTEIPKGPSTRAISLHSESASSNEDDPTCDSEDGTSFDFPLRERNQSSFTSEDKTASLGSRAGSEADMLPDYHANGGHKESNASSPTSDDATECFEEKNQAPTKKILKKVSAYFNTGELVAIMGPSGCGKTTLLDLLTGRRRDGHVEGQVYVNGMGLGQVQDWYSRKIGYVLQLAVPYYEELTVRQNLFFAAHMRLPRETSAAEKYERVEQIIAETGLTQMADTIIGGSVGPGLSGGQKRRLCVALQLINMPSVLFLDEPTSGLDASSSLELLNHLNLVAESGRLIILTIHQPRLEIFHLFHKILFLCDGQVAYYGEPAMAPEIFIKAYASATTDEFRQSEEAPKIDAKNPADTIMDLLNCSEARRAILDYYQTSGEPQAVQEAIRTSQENAGKANTMETTAKNTVDGAGRFNRIFVLEGRTAEKQTLGQLLYFPLIFFTFGIIVGTVYFEAEDRDGILLMSAYCVYCCASPLFLSSVLMAHLNKALNIYHLERADGCGRSLENVVQTFVRTTALCVFPVIMCSVMSYFMVMTSYDIWKLLFVTIISLVLNQTWIAVYMMVICAHPQIAHRICPMVSAIGGFAGGFLVPRPQMPHGYNLLFYINPQFYGYAAITKVLLKNVHLKCHYDSKLSCVSTDGNAVLTRFGLDTVNPYEHLVIMLGMTVLSLLLSWLFLEAKYFTPRCFSKTPPAFSVEIPLERVEVSVSPSDEPSAKEEEEEEEEEKQDEIEMQIPSSRNFRINRYSSNRVSAKSRLGLIRENHGFHSVKLPRSASPRAHSPEVTLADLQFQSTDGDHAQFPRRRNRLDSVMEEDLWKRTRQQMRERKTKLEHRMSRVENIARQCSIKPAQSLQSLSMRKKNKYNTPPRRTTVASSAFSEEKRKEFSLKRDGKFNGRNSDPVFREELEDSASPLVIRPLTRFGDGGSTGEVFKRSSEMIEEENEELEEDEVVWAPEKVETHQGSLGGKVHEKNPSSSFGAKPESSQHSNNKDDGRPVKRVSMYGFTESLDV